MGSSLSYFSDSNSNSNDELCVEQKSDSINIISERVVDSKTEEKEEKSKIEYTLSDSLSLESTESLKQKSSYVTTALLLSSKRLITGNSDGKLVIWDLTTRKIESILHEHKSEITTIKLLSPEKIISASRDSKIFIWNLITGTIETRLLDHSGPVTCIDMITDFTGSYVVSASEDHTVKIWNLDGLCIKTLMGHNIELGGILILPGNKIASIGNDYSIKIWDFILGTCLQEITGSGYCWTKLSYGLISSKIIIGSNNTNKSNSIKIIDTCTGFTEDKQLNADKNCITKNFCLDSNNIIYTTSISDNRIRTYDITSGVCLNTIIGTYLISSCNILSPTQILITDVNNIAEIWNIKYSF